MCLVEVRFFINNEVKEISVLEGRLSSDPDKWVNSIECLLKCFAVLE